MVQINSGASAMMMANEIFGNGVTVVSASYTGDNRSSGIYQGGDSAAPNATPSDTGVILSTGRARGFDIDGNTPNDTSSYTSSSNGVNNNADFNALAGASTYDAAWLDVDFIPTGDTLSMQFVFSSDEYPEFANSIYNDIVGVWINGQPAELTVGDGSTSVGNVNQIDNINLYNDNMGSAFQTEMDGFTATLSLKMNVIPGVVNSIRIGIADVSDSSYDSNLLIAGDSVQTQLIAGDDTYRMDKNDTETFNVLGNDTTTTGGTLTITHVNGKPAAVGTPIPMPNGHTITLNADGTFTVQTDGQEELAPFSYTVSDGVNTDTAFVTINTIPCFVAGTMIRTPEGERRVEDLAPGDLVLTKDNGAQPLRWIGRRTVAAIGELAPIRISAHTFGIHKTLLVSPQHRILIRDGMSELLFGEEEVLVSAKHLVNEATITIKEGGEIEYVHLLFDAHQVIFSEGLPTESFLPGPQAAQMFEAHTLDEISEIFPEVDPRTGAGYSPAARRILRAHEALVLMAATAPPLPIRLDRQVARAA